MSSTRRTGRLRRFFAERIAPAAERLRARGVAFFPLGPTPEESWYEAPKPGPEFRTLERNELAAALEAEWRDVPELAELAPRLLALASDVEPPAEDDGEVSPFVYVMY
jgi:hypothetical protein